MRKILCVARIKTGRRPVLLLIFMSYSILHTSYSKLHTPHFISPYSIYSVFYILDNLLCSDLKAYKLIGIPGLSFYTRNKQNNVQCNKKNQKKKKKKKPFYLNWVIAETLFFLPDESCNHESSLPQVRPCQRDDTSKAN